MYIRKLLNPKSDYVFKRIFGYVGNEEITKHLLEAILEKDVSEVKLDNNKILEKDLLDDKIGVLDIRAKIDKNTNCNIEMQIIDRKNIEKRLLFYWSKIYISDIKNGEDYNSLNKTIIILFTDYEIEKLKGIEKYITKWNIKEKKADMILTEMLEIYIIEIPKFNKYEGKNGKSSLDEWIKFIESPEVADMSKEGIKAAKRVLEEISNDEREIWLAELRQKYRMDQKAIEDAGIDKGLKQGFERGVAHGFDQGLEEGKQQGIKQGLEEGKIKMAIKMKEEGIDISVISKITELSEDEIKAIQ